MPSSASEKPQHSQGGSGKVVTAKSGGKTTQNPFGNDDFDDFPNSTANRRIHLASPEDERFKASNFPRNTSASALMMPPTPTSATGGGEEEGASSGSSRVGWGLGLLTRKGSTSNSTSRSASPSKTTNNNGRSDTIEADGSSSSSYSLGRRQSTTLVSFPPTMREETLAEIPAGQTKDEMEARRMESTIAFTNPVSSSHRPLEPHTNEFLISDLMRLDTDTLLGGGGPSDTSTVAHALVAESSIDPLAETKLFSVDRPFSVNAEHESNNVIRSPGAVGRKSLTLSPPQGSKKSLGSLPSSLASPSFGGSAYLSPSSSEGRRRLSSSNFKSNREEELGSTQTESDTNGPSPLLDLANIADVFESSPQGLVTKTHVHAGGGKIDAAGSISGGHSEAGGKSTSSKLLGISVSGAATSDTKKSRSVSPAPAATPPTLGTTQKKTSPSTQMHSPSPPLHPMQTNKAAAHTPAKNNSNAASVPTLGEQEMPALDLPPASTFLSSVFSPKKRASTTNTADTVGGGRDDEAANSSSVLPPPPSTPQKSVGHSTSLSSAAAELIKAKMSPQTKPMRRNSDEARHESESPSHVAVERNIFGQKELHGQSPQEAVVGEEAVALPLEGRKGGLLPKLRPLSSLSLLSPSHSPQRPPVGAASREGTHHSESADAVKNNTKAQPESPATVSHDPSPQGTSASSLTTPSSTPSAASLARPNSHMLPSLTAFSLASPLESSSFNALVSAPLIKGASLAGIHEQHQEAQREREEATRREKEELERILAEREAEEKARKEAHAVEERRAKLGKLLAANNPDEAAMPPITTPRDRSSDTDKEEEADERLGGAKNKSATTTTTTVEEVVVSSSPHHKKGNVGGGSLVADHTSNRAGHDDSSPLIIRPLENEGRNSNVVNENEPSSGHAASAAQKLEHQSKLETAGGGGAEKGDDGVSLEEKSGLSNKAKIELGKASYSLSDREEVVGGQAESGNPLLRGQGAVNDHGLKQQRVETAGGGKDNTPTSAPVAFDHDEHFAAAVDASVKGEPLPMNAKKAPATSLELKGSSSSTAEGSVDRGSEEENTLAKAAAIDTGSGEGEPKDSTNEATSSSGAAQSSVSTSAPSSSSSGGLWTYAGSFYAGSYSSSSASSSPSFFSGNGLRDYICGTLSGIGKVVAGYPFDTLKGRVQGGDYGGSVRRALRETWRREGLLAFYQGVTFPAVNVCFVGGILFYVNGAIRKHQQPDGIEPLTYGQMFWAGCGGGAAVGLWTVPIEVIKIRMQLLNKSEAVAARKEWLARANASSSAATNFFRSSAEEKVFAAQAVRDAARPKVPPFKPTAQLIAEEAAGAVSSSTRTAGANFVSKLVARASAASTGVAANTGAAEGAAANLGKPIATNARSIVASLRPIDFFSGFTPTMIRECGTFGLFFPLNEYFKRRIALRRDKIDLERLQRRQADQRKARLYGLAEGRLGYHDVVVPQPCFTTRVMAAGLAGVCCWLPVYPADQIKTKMQLHPAGTYRTWLHCGAEIVRNEGIKTGLFKGLGPCLVRAFPAYAAQFLLFEKLTEAWKKSSKK